MATVITESQGQLIALLPNGTERWRHPLPPCPDRDPWWPKMVPSGSPTAGASDNIIRTVRQVSSCSLARPREMAAWEPWRLGRREPSTSWDKMQESSGC